MTPQSIVLDCVRRGIELSGADGELCVRAPSGAMTPELRNALKANKPALLAFLGDGRRHCIASYEQQRLWFLAQLDADSAAYTIEFAAQLDGPLHVQALSDALQTIVRRHEPLRTTYRSIDGDVVQVVHESLPAPVDYIDLQGMPQNACERKTAEIIQACAADPFNLELGPVLRATLAQRAPQSYVLVFTVHHIAVDGWSLGILFRELSDLYNQTITSNTQPELTPLQAAYTDCARRQRLALDAESRDLHYWLEHLTPIPPRLDLRGLGQSVEPTNNAGFALHALDETLTGQFNAWCRDRAVTPFTGLLAIYAALLYRYAAQQSFAVGVPVAGRNTPGSESLIGFFVNMLVMRCECDPAQTFVQHLERFKHDVLSALEHQGLPFARLVEALHPERSLDDSPLFQVGFSMQNFELVRLELRDITVTLLRRAMADAKYALCLFAREIDGRLRLRLEYRGDVLDENSAQRMLRHYELLLRGVVADAARPISAYALLGDGERVRVIEAFNRTEKAYDRNTTVHGLFEARVRERPNAIAVADGANHYTFAEIDAWANRIAQWLVARGAAPESTVGVLVNRSASMVASVLGVLKAGGAYVPLDPAYPPQRIQQLLRDSDARYLLSDRDIDPQTAAISPALLRVDADVAMTHSSEAPRVAVRADNLAYVMYTSGSTGTPKGVCVEHRNIVRLVQSVNFGTLDTHTAGLFYAPLAFDASTIEMFGPLLNGGRIVIQPQGAASMQDLAETIEAHGVNTLWLTTGLFHQMAERGPLDKLRGLRQWLAGGDVLQAGAVRRVMEALPGCCVINGYGPTEGTTLATAYEMRGPAEVMEPVPIGRPLQNSRIYVLDEFQQPVPVGVPGELYIGGEGVARGYLGKPELTNEQFLPDPFSGIPGARMYRSGDFARWNENGLLLFLGRRDGQIKLRGYRIELDEIEKALREHPQVAEAAAAVKKRGADKALVGYVTPRAQGEIDLAGVRAYLRDRLPAFMAPALLMTLDAIPLTPNGKVDRAALPVPSATDQAPEKEYVAPRTDTEKRIARIYEDVLGIERPSVNASFFDMGGHSLMATQLASRIRDEFNADISLRTYFLTPTIEALAEELSKIQTNSSGFDSAILRQSRSLEEQLNALDCVAAGGDHRNHRND